MAWFKVDDRLYSHPKWVSTPPRARALWVTAGSWCAANGTDGKVPRSALALLGGNAKDAAALVDAGLWRELKSGWIFHEWTIYQPDAASERAKRKADSDAGVRGNHRRWHANRGLVVPECPYCNGLSEDEPPMSPEEEEMHRPPDRVPDRAPDVFSIGSASPVPVPDTHSDTQVGGGGYVSNAQEPPPPPTRELLESLSEPWRCTNHQGVDAPCHQCKRFKAAWRDLEAEQQKARKDEARRKEQSAAQARRLEAEQTLAELANPEAQAKIQAAKEQALQAVKKKEVA